MQAQTLRNNSGLKIYPMLFMNFDQGAEAGRRERPHWFRTTKNPDVSAGPLVSAFLLLLALLVRYAVLIFSLAHSLTSERIGR